MLAESLETVFDEAHFMINLHSFLQPPSSPQWNLLPKWVICPSSFQEEQLPNFAFYRHISNSFSVSLPIGISAAALVCIFSSIIASEPWLCKSKEFSNQGLKANRSFKCDLIFLLSKNNKNRQPLYEIIRVSSLSIIFVEFSFKPVCSTMVANN